MEWEGADDMKRRLGGLSDYVREATEKTFQYYAPRVEAAAKQNAKWTDRTTNARNGLISRAGTSGKNRVYLVLAHQVPYGIYLETRWSGKYAIVMPTLNTFGPKIMNTIEGLIKEYRE